MSVPYLRLTAQCTRLVRGAIVIVLRGAHDAGHTGDGMTMRL